MIRVGLVDSGLAPEILAAGATLLVPADDSAHRQGDPHGHGTALSRLLAQTVPPAELACVPVFDHRGVTTPVQVAAAVDALAEAGAEMIVLALGLVHDREVLRLACQRAVAAGRVVVASAPARGDPCYPAAYPGMVAVSGDARCRPGQTSCLDPALPLFGACVLPPATDPSSLRGASMAAGHFAAWLWRHFPDASARRREAIIAACAFLGRERITRPPQDDS